MADGGGQVCGPAAAILDNLCISSFLTPSLLPDALPDRLPRPVSTWLSSDLRHAAAWQPPSGTAEGLLAKPIGGGIRSAAGPGGIQEPPASAREN